MAEQKTLQECARAVLGEMCVCIYQSREMVLEVFTEKMNEQGVAVYWIGSRSSAHLGSTTGDVISIRCSFDRDAGWTPAYALWNGDDFWVNCWEGRGVKC